MEGEIYEFPMTVDEAVFLHDCLVEVKNTLYVGVKHFTVEKKNTLDNLIESLGTWIDNRSMEC